MSSIPPMGPAFRRLAARAATQAAAWQPRLGHALRTRTAPLRALTEPALTMPAQILSGARLPMAGGPTHHSRALGPSAGSHRAATAVGAAAVILSGALLVAAPGSASAQTVRPTTPGSSAFTVPQGASPTPGVVQVAGPSAYQLAHENTSAQDDVAVAANLLAVPAVPVVPAEQAAAGATSADHAHPDGQGHPAGQAEAPAEQAPAEQAPAEPAPAEPAPAAEPEPAPEPAPAPEWSAPVPGAPTSNPYGKVNPEYAAGYHTGVDFAVAPGTPLLAVGKATVVSAGWSGAYGKEVVLKLADGHFAEYAHMSSISVKAGDRVSPGQQIGRSGNTGNSTGPHLHFEIRSKNHYGAVINPVAYLSARGVGF
ncbi:M23 family metallopeptidase [Kitasatospora sp. NPDC054939]